MALIEHLTLTHPRHFEAVAAVTGTPEQVFEFVDDHRHLTEHMAVSSPLLGDGGVEIEIDEKRGHVVGSRIHMGARMLGMRLFLDEVVTVTHPPDIKVWETVGEPHLFVVGSHRMGVRIARADILTSVAVFIDYEPPSGFLTRWVGRLFGGFYARWCVNEMLDSVIARFGVLNHVHAA